MTSNRITVLVPLILALAYGAAMAGGGNDAVVVTNGLGAPVPVLVTNPQVVSAPAPKSVFTDLFLANTVTVMPAPGVGKRFVAKHFSMFLGSNISGIPLTDASCVLALHQGSISSTIAIFTLQRADAAGDMGVSQNDYLVLGPADSLDMTCSSNPGNSSGRVTVSGDVLSGQ